VKRERVNLRIGKVCVSLRRIHLRELMLVQRAQPPAVLARPPKEHQTLMPRTRTIGNLNHPPRTLTQQSIETCLLVEERGDDVTRVSRVVYKRHECSIAPWTKEVSTFLRGTPEISVIYFSYNCSTCFPFVLFKSLNS
jgi:hypothetical protein